MTSSLAVVLLLLLLGVARAQLELPALPRDYSVVIQQTNTLKNTTVDLHEYVDYSGDRLRVDVHIPPSGGELVELYAFDFNSVSFIKSLPGADPTCTTYNLSDPHVRATVPSGYYDPYTHHMRSSNGMLSFGVTWTAVSYRKERGIDVQCYEGTLKLDDSSHHVNLTGTREVCFGMPTWTFFGSSPTQLVPVSMREYGNFSWTDGSYSMQGSYDVISAFADFKVGRSESAHFFPADAGAFCPALVQKRFPTVPESFTVSAEANILQGNRTVSVVERVEAGRRLRYDTVRHNTVESHIWDHTAGTHTMWIHNRDDSCFVEMGEFSFREQTLSHLFSQGGLNYSYGGPSTARGIKTETWLAVRPSDGVVLLWHFTNPHAWRMRGVELGAGEAVPVRLYIKGNGFRGPFEHLYEFTEFTPGIPPVEAFVVPDRIICEDRTGGLAPGPPMPLLNDDYTATFAMTVAPKVMEIDRDDAFDVRAAVYLSQTSCSGSPSFNQNLRFFESGAFSQCTQVDANTPGLTLFIRGRCTHEHQYDIVGFTSESACLGGESPAFELQGAEDQCLTVNLMGLTDVALELRGCTHARKPSLIWSADLVEAYDYKNDLLRLERVDSGHLQIYNFSSFEHFDVRPPDDGDYPACRTWDTRQRPRDAHWLEHNNPDHVIRPSEAFHERDYNFSYRGDWHVVRGIRCRAWEGVINITRHHQRHTLAVRWYWSLENPPRPIRFFAIGNTTVRTFDWISYDPQVPKPELFQLPQDALCARLQTKPFPTVIPDDFEVTIEVSNATDTFSMREFHSYTQNFVRLEPVVGRPDVEVYDIDRGVAYVVIDGKCQVEPFQKAPNARFIALDASGHHLSHVVLDEMAGAPYGGRTVVRGIPADVWQKRVSVTVAHRGIVYNGTVRWAFAAPGHHGWHGVKFDPAHPPPLENRMDLTISSISGAWPDRRWKRSQSFVGVRYGPIPPALFEVPIECHGKGNASCSMGPTVCQSLNRLPCIHTNEMCGPCRPGFSTGAPPNDHLDGNTFCASKVSPCPPPAGSASKTVSEATAAGLSVGMLVLGVVLGMIVHYCCCSRQYKGRVRLDDDRERSVSRTGDEGTDLREVELGGTGAFD